AVGTAAAHPPRIRAWSAAVGAVFVPLYTSLSLFVNSHLPWSVASKWESIHFFGSPATWIYGWIYPPHESHVVVGTMLQITFWFLLGALCGFLVWKKFAVSVHSILVHSIRLTALSWLAIVGMALLINGYMAASGVH